MKFLRIFSLIVIFSLGGSLAAFAAEGSTSSTSDKYTVSTKITESNNDCANLGVTFDTYTKGTTGSDSSYVAVEISEPISSVNQKIQSGNLTVSEVVWKFSCDVYKEEVLYSNGTREVVTYYSGSSDSEEGSNQTSEKDRKSVSLYVEYAKGCPAGLSCGLVQIIRGTSGTGILKTYIAIMYRWAAGIVGIVAVLVMVVSGIQISMDQGGGENVTAAKNRIMQSIAGLVILFLSALILYTINPTFFQK